MRMENKYRVWDKEEKRMIVHEQDFIPCIVTSFGVFRLNPYHKENFYELMPKGRFEIMRYSGQRDKKGIERYEGDIITRNTGYVFIERALHHSVGASNVYGYNYHPEDEIIGNIYANPDLSPEK